MTNTTQSPKLEQVRPHATVVGCMDPKNTRIFSALGISLPLRSCLMSGGSEKPWGGFPFE